MNGLYIGRFQPFHLGHISVLEQIQNLNLVDNLIIGIGSANESYTKKNPFTAGERIEMIYNSIADKFDFKSIVIPIPDISSNSTWVSHVLSNVPKVDIVFTNNPFIRLLFEDAGFEVRSTPIVMRNTYSGTYIREQIALGNIDIWHNLVPSSISEYIIYNELTSRLRRLNLTDVL